MSRKNGKQPNIVLIALIAILAVCFVLLGYGFYKYFYAGVGTTKYGERLEGIDKHSLSETIEEDIQKVYASNGNIKSVVVTVKGKIVYITIDYAKALKASDAKSEALKALSPIGEDNLTYYDVQFLLKYSADEENSVFPIFGAKNANSLKVVW